MPIVIATPVADACQCVPPSLTRAVTRAKVAFVGTVTKEHKQRQCDGPRCFDAYTYTVRVETVWKGTLDKTVTVDAGQGRDCTFGRLASVPVGTRWLFISSHDAPVLARRCTGTQLATTEVLAALERIGKPTRP